MTSTDSWVSDPVTLTMMCRPSGVSAGVGQRLADDAQNLGPAASKGSGGQTIVGFEDHLAVGRRLTFEVDELAEGLGEVPRVVVIQAQVVDGGAELQADLLQNRLDAPAALRLSLPLTMRAVVKLWSAPS